METSECSGSDGRNDDKDSRILTWDSVAPRRAELPRANALQHHDGRLSQLMSTSKESIFAHVG